MAGLKVFLVAALAIAAVVAQEYEGENFPRPYKMRKFRGPEKRARTVESHIKNSYMLKGFREMLSDSAYSPDTFGTRTINNKIFFNHIGSDKILGNVTIFAPNKRAVKNYKRKYPVRDTVTANAMALRHVVRGSISPDMLYKSSQDSLLQEESKYFGTIAEDYPFDLDIKVTPYGNAFVNGVRIKRAIKASNGWIYILKDVLEPSSDLVVRDEWTLKDALFGSPEFTSLDRKMRNFSPNYQKFIKRVWAADAEPNAPNFNQLDQKSNNFIVFAPTDEAFQSLHYEGVIQRLSVDDESKNSRIIKEHICKVGQNFDRYVLRQTVKDNKQEGKHFTCTNLNGNKLKFTLGRPTGKNNDGLKINGITILNDSILDYRLANGVMLPIDGVLVPEGDDVVVDEE